MTTDYRALCAELLAHAQTAQAVAVGEGLWDGSEDDGLFDRARAALAHPEPVGPSDEELINAAEDAGFAYADNGFLFNSHYESFDIKSEVLSFARAVLTRWGISPVAE